MIVENRGKMDSETNKVEQPRMTIYDECKMSVTNTFLLTYIPKKWNVLSKRMSPYITIMNI